MIFHGSDENYTRNGSLLLEESIALFDGRTNSVRCLSVDELNTISVDCNCWFRKDLFATWYISVWEERSVLLKVFNGQTIHFESSQCCREIIIATQMSIHKNSHRLLACCLETEYPVLIYDGVEKGTLYDRIFRTMNQNNHQALEWEDRLRIAWEISHAISYLHSAFPRPIIYADLKPNNVFFNQDNVAKLSDFSLSVCPPKGKTYLELPVVVGSPGYLAPELTFYGQLMQGSDVFSFGVLLLVLLTGRDTRFQLEKNGESCCQTLVNWVTENFQDKGIIGIIDPAIRTVTSNEDLDQEQLQASIELAVRCIATEPESRPTMVDIAKQLNDMIRSRPLNLII